MKSTVSHPFAASLVLAATLLSSSARAADAELAAKAQAILKANCSRYHGLEAPAKGGFNYVLDRDKLVARKGYSLPESLCIPRPCRVEVRSELPQ